MPASRRRMPKEGTVSAIKGPELLSEENVRERGRIVGKIKQTFEPIRKRAPKRERRRKGKKGATAVRVAGKDGIVRTVYVNPEELRTNPKYANLRDDIRMAPGYDAMKYKPVPNRRAIVPYDEEFAKKQAEIEKTKLTKEEKERREKDRQLNAMLDDIRVTLRLPKGKRVKKVRDKIREELAPAFETKAYREAKEIAVTTAYAAKQEFEEKSREETKKKKRAGMVKLSVPPFAEDVLGTFKVVVGIIGLMLLLVLLVWIANIF